MDARPGACTASDMGGARRSSMTEGMRGELLGGQAHAVHPWCRRRAARTLTAHQLEVTALAARIAQLFPISVNNRVIRYSLGTIESISMYSSRAW